MITWPLPSRRHCVKTIVHVKYCNDTFVISTQSNTVCIMAMPILNRIQRAKQNREQLRRDDSPLSLCVVLADDG
jgi:hypothetical protein